MQLSPAAHSKQPPPFRGPCSTGQGNSAAFLSDRTEQSKLHVASACIRRSRVVPAFPLALPGSWRWRCCWERGGSSAVAERCELPWLHCPWAGHWCLVLCRKEPRAWRQCLLQLCVSDSCVLLDECLWGRTSAHLSKLPWSWTTHSSCCWQDFIRWMPILAILPQGNGWPQAGAGFQQGLLQEELGALSPAAPSHGLPGSLLFLGGRMAPGAAGTEQGWAGGWAVEMLTSSSGASPMWEHDGAGRAWPKASPVGTVYL